MIVRTILDTDLYKFTTSYAYIKLFPSAMGTFSFNDRNETKYTEDFLDRLKAFTKALEIQKYCKKKIRCSFGIGTNLTNDTGFEPSNIVMKLTQCKMNPNQEWRECVKLSDDEGKHTGSPEEVKACLYELKLLQL